MQHGGPLWETCPPSPPVNWGSNNTFWAQGPSEPQSIRHCHQPTCVNSLVLLDVRQLFERLFAVSARILAHVAVHERVLGELLRRRKRLEAQQTLMILLVRTVALLRVALHVRLVLKLLRHHQRAQS